MQDAIFEGLPDIEARGKWHIGCADAIAKHNSSGSDWKLTLHRVHAAILKITAKTAGSTIDAVNAVVDLHEKAGSGQEVESAAWSAAWSAAYAEISEAVLIAVTQGDPQ